MRHGSLIASAISALGICSSAYAAQTIPSCRGPGLTPPVPLTSHVSTSEDYPPLSRMLNETGETIVEYQILADGQVGELKVTKSSGSLRLDDATTAFVKRFKFKPALVASVATACTNAIALRWVIQTNDQDAISALASFTATPIYVPKSDFPPGAAERNEDGYAVGIVFVSDHNTIDQVVLARPSQFADLNAATVALLAKKTVTSPTFGGAPSRSMITIPVVWSLGKPSASGPLPTQTAPVPEGDTRDGAQAPPNNKNAHREK
jgi:TonB family protein